MYECLICHRTNYWNYRTPAMRPSPASMLLHRPRALTSEAFSFGRSASMRRRSTIFVWPTSCSTCASSIPAVCFFGRLYQAVCLIRHAAMACIVAIFVQLLLRVRGLVCCIVAYHHPTVPQPHGCLCCIRTTVASAGALKLLCKRSGCAC